MRSNFLELSRARVVSPIAMRKTVVYSVGNYSMTGRVLGKGHFARVEEATHKIIGKKVAIKVIDLTLIKEEYARRNLHREPRVMARLQHPCIAALYETMMHGPRLYVAMEAAGGGDLCSLVLAARGGGRGLPETAARPLAAQLVSAVRHMHSRGVVHRDLKMENIMLDSTKQFIKIVDFGLSNLWGCGGALHTPCGSLEYAAPELFVDGRRYGPEVDLWSVGVIVYGMVTGSLPFTAPSPESASRAQLRAAITRGFGRKQRDALAPFTTECKAFVEHLLQPRAESRMRIEEAARHRWIRRPGLNMKRHPFAALDPNYNRALYRQIAELCGISFTDVVSQVKSDPFGPVAGIYNIKIHLHQLKSGGMELWTANTEEPRPATPPEYQTKFEAKSVPNIPTQPVKHTPSQTNDVKTAPTKQNGLKMGLNQKTNAVKIILNQVQTLQNQNGVRTKITNGVKITPRQIQKEVKTDPREKQIPRPRQIEPKPPDTKLAQDAEVNNLINDVKKILQSPPKRPTRLYGKRLGTGDVGLTSIREHSDKTRVMRDERLNSCPNSVDKKISFYKRAGDGLPSWRSCGFQPLSARPGLTVATIKRAAFGNTLSQLANGRCSSDRSMPVGWLSSRISKESHLQRLRRTAPMK
ncbi:serine/threonine-protein kinase MARK2-like [Aricia agestis]|uniref:serine/threonine-protein kinase MARK2-like n=1 Tax=Aricia agestis TaxID=91739 RepID=UPI001C20B6D6|nr:serine/threonine-protein kinase MARK2-like [Aricia agestis]